MNANLNEYNNRQRNITNSQEEFSMFFTLLFALSFSVRENEKRVCVCWDACPKVCDVFEKILVYNTPDLDAEFKKVKTKYMDVRFCHAPNGFSFNIGTFDDVQVQFDSFHLSPKSHIKVMVTRPSTAEPSFNNLDVTFIGYSSSQPLDLTSIIMKNVDSRIQNLAPLLYTQSFEADNSVYDFVNVTIKANCSDPALAIDILRGYDLDLTIGQNVITLGSSTFYFEGKATATISTELSDIKLTVNGIATEDMPYLILIGFPYTTFKGKYPENYIIQMQNLQENTVIAEEERLPISLDGARVNVYVSQTTTTIEGDSSCDLGLYVKQVPAFRKTVRVVKLNGNLEVYDSHLDVVLDIFNPGLQVYQAPWTFCVGSGGVSTLLIKETLYSGLSSVSFFKYHCDFNVYPDDDIIQDLVKEPHRILLVDTNKTVFTTDSVSILPADDLQIPGFFSSSNCISIQLVKSYPFEIQLTATLPSELPLKLCYADQLAQCNPTSDGFFINDYTISKLSECIYPQFTDVTITLKKNLSMIQFDTIRNTKNVEFKITSSSEKVYSLGIIHGATNTYLKSLSFTRVNLGGLAENEEITIPTTFIKCGFDSITNKTFKFAADTQVNGDDLFVSEIIPHVDSISNLNLNIKQTKSILVQQDNFIFDDEHQLPYSDLTTFSINVEGDLHFGVNGPSKDFTLNHCFLPSINPNRLYITQFSSEHTFTYNHGDFDVEIIRNKITTFDHFISAGKGEVTFANDFEASSRICVSTDKSLCKGDYDLTVDNDNGECIQNETIKDKAILDVYINYTIDISKLNSKYVIIKNMAQATLSFDLTNEITEPLLTTTQVNGFDITFTNPQNTEFGHIEFINCNVQPIDFGLTAVNYIGPYSSIISASSINIKGYINLYGELTQVPKSPITFDANDNESRRFRGEIPDQSTISVLSEKIKINEYEISLPSKNNGYDVDFYTTRETTFTLTCDTNDMATFPSIKFSHLQSTTVNFEGEWPAVTSSDDIKLLFEHTLLGFTLNIKTENVPAIFSGVQMDFNINCQVDNPKIYGLFNVISEQYHQMTISGTKSIHFEGGIGVDYKSWIKILNPIQVYVSNIVLTNKDRNQGYVSFQNYVNCESNSMVTISKMENIVFNPIFEVYGVFTDSLDSDKITNFLKKEVQLYSIQPSDVRNFQDNVKEVQFVDPKPITHGFIGDNFGVTVSNEGSVVLKNTQPPSNTPVDACYRTTKSCELWFDESNITNFISVIPKNIKSVNFVFGQSNTKVLSFDDSKLSQISLNMSSSTQAPVNVKVSFGSDRVNTMIVQNLNLEISGTNSVNTATFINSISNSFEGIKELNYDFASYSRSPITEYSGKLNVKYSGANLVYLANGWSFDQYTIESTKVPHFSIDCTTLSTLTLDISDDIDTIIDCPIVIHSKQIDFGKNWDKLSPLSNLNITLTQPLNQIVIRCHSNPFSALPILDGVALQFAKDALPIHSTKQLSLQNRSITIDLSFTSNEESKLYFDNGISLSENSTIEVLDSTPGFSCIANEIIVEDETDSAACNIEVTNSLKLYGNARLSAALNLSSANVEFHWWKSHMPFLMNQIGNVPQSVSVHFDGKTSESDYIKDQSYPLVELGLNCEKWLSNVQFKSSVSQFDGKGAKAKLTCESGVLTLTGSDGISTMSPGVIAAIVISCIVGVALLTLGIFFYIKKRRQTQQSNPLLTQSLTSNQ